MAAGAPKHPIFPPKLDLVPQRRQSFLRRRWRWIVGFLLFLIVNVGIAVRFAITHAEPILRTRVIETLAARFKGRVELASLHVSVAHGIQVFGSGLQIYGATDPNPHEPGVQPLLEIGEFRSQTPLRDLFREPMRVHKVYVSGLIMNIPPAGDRQEIRSMRRREKMSIFVESFICEDTKLIINTSRPGKLPLEFDISDLRMKDIGANQPLQFDATLINPRPVGDIHSSGHFGPFNETSPGHTAVEGTYSFTQADLGTLPGISGILWSTGQYSGTLRRIEVRGKTDTPDFRLAVSGHRVPLHTDFHAIVDGTDGDTYLEPVRAQILTSSLTARGKVVRIKGARGHDIELYVTLEHARIEDLLKLGVRTDPQVMTGAVEMKTKVSLRPGAEDVANRMKLAGDFQVPQAHFTSEKLQQRIDSLSLRGQGKPKQAREHSSDDVTSDLQGTFK